MKNARVLIGIASVVVLGGAGVGYTMWQASAQQEEALDKLRRAVEAELKTDPPDRSSVAEVLRRLDAQQQETPATELTRLEAQLQFHLGRVDRAWQALASVADSPQATLADRRLAIQILARLHAESGRETHGQGVLRQVQALLANEFDADAAFTAWQVAYRLAAVEDFAAMRQAILDAAPESDVGKVVTSTTHELALHLARRLGVPGPVDGFERHANGGDASAQAARLVLDTKGDGERVSPGQLRSLHRGMGDSSPPELDLLVSMSGLFQASNDGDAAGMNGAVREIADIVREVPSWIEARHALVAGTFALVQASSATSEQVAAAIEHLRWLRRNAAPVDARQADWEQLQAALGG